MTQFRTSHFLFCGQNKNSLPTPTPEQNNEKQLRFYLVSCKYLVSSMRMKVDTDGSPEVNTCVIYMHTSGGLRSEVGLRGLKPAYSPPILGLTQE